MSENSGSADAGNPAGTGDVQQQQQQAPWYGEVDGDLKTWADNKGFKTPGEALRSYHNLEKVYGHDKAGRTVVLPGDKAEVAELDAFYNKLGRPETADKYELELPSEADKDLVDWFKTTAHKHGLSAKQAKALFADYNAMSGSRATQTSEQAAARFAGEEAGLKKDWGAAYDANLNAAKRAAQSYGFTKDEIDALESKIGYAGVMKRFAAIGEKQGEGRFVATDSRAGAFGSLTPDQAKLRIAEKEADPSFRERLMKGDTTAQEERDQLYRAAYGKF